MPIFYQTMTSVTLSLKGFRRFWKEFPLLNLRSREVNMFYSTATTEFIVNLNETFWYASSYFTWWRQKSKLANTENILLMSEGDLLRLAGGGFPRGLKCSKQSLPGNPWDILPKIQFGMTCRKCKTLKETDTLLNSLMLKFTTIVMAMAKFQFRRIDKVLLLLLLLLMMMMTLESSC